MLVGIYEMHVRKFIIYLTSCPVLSCSLCFPSVPKRGSIEWKRGFLFGILPSGWQTRTRVVILAIHHNRNHRFNKCNRRTTIPTTTCTCTFNCPSNNCWSLKILEISIGRKRSHLRRPSSKPIYMRRPMTCYPP